LLRIASKHARKISNDIVILLATDGYADMFRNFLCSLQFPNEILLGSNASSGFIVITRQVDIDIIKIAEYAGLGIFTDIPTIDMSSCHTGSFSFGTLCYQKLILLRTTTVMYLLRLGFNVAIADIDVVWRENALDTVHALMSFMRDKEDDKTFADVAVTLDGEEICGCFVYLSQSPDSIVFWATITDMHTTKVKFAESNEGVFEDGFFDSEQKLLTQLILHQKYNGTAVFGVLPPHKFPSGRMFFNQWTFHDRLKNKPSVIHNNFVIGDEIKKVRFQRHGLWYIYAGDKRRFQDPLSCNPNYVSDTWNRIFSNVSYEWKIPTLCIFSPIHNTVVLTDRNHAGFEILSCLDGFEETERFMQIQIKDDTLIKTEILGDFAVFRIEAASRLGRVITITTHANRDEYLLGGLSVDIAINRSDFAFDRGGLFHVEADVNVANFYDTFKNNSRSSLLKSRDGPNNTNSNCSHVHNKVLIKVISYARPDSLSRLLNSLGFQN
jgi:hypothetical protein